VKLVICDLLHRAKPPATILTSRRQIDEDDEETESQPASLISVSSHVSATP
jgi:hypothetical protein